MNSHLPSRVPRCIWNVLCQFPTIHANILYMHILTKFNSHKSHYSIHKNNIKISSHWLINKSKQFILNYPTTQKSHKNHVNSETLGSALFTVIQVRISSLGSKILRPITRPSRPQQISIHKMVLSQRINQVGKDLYLLELSELHQIGVHA